jgi:hypothetical protein
MAGIAFELLHMGAYTMLDNLSARPVAIQAHLRAFASFRHAFHGMAPAAFHSSPEMDVGKHLQVSFAVSLHPPLVTHVFFAWGKSAIVAAGEIPLMAGVAAIAGIPYKIMTALAMAVNTALEMAGIAVVPEEVPINLSVTPGHEIFFPLPGSHCMGKKRLISGMTAAATLCAH